MVVFSTVHRASQRHDRASNGTVFVALIRNMAEAKKNAAAVALGRLGGLKGGKARARKLTAEQRRESARQAAVARWSKKRN